jgi:hypothetical protein
MIGSAKWFALFLAACVAGFTLHQEIDRPPERIELRALANLYGPVDFDHKTHVDAIGTCGDCHHKPFGEPRGCGECHEPRERSLFDHESHWDYAGCDICHQATTAEQLVCSACHQTPFDPDNLAVLGLKGAYHAQCMGCHEELGFDTSCNACHAKNP